MNIYLKPASKFSVFLSAIMLLVCYNFPAAAKRYTSYTLSTSIDNSIVFDLPDSLYSIRKIVLSGNFRTKDHIILREMYLSPGTLVTKTEIAERIERDRQRIFNTRLFTTVHAFTVEQDSSAVDIYIEMQERWYFVPNLIFKLADRNFNEWWYNQDRDLSRVNYGLRLKHNNFLGRAQQVAFQAQFGFTRIFKVNYYNPYIDRQQKTGLGFTYAFSENTNIATYTANNQPQFSPKPYVIRTTQLAGLNVTRRPSYNASHTVGLFYLASNFADTVLLENPDYVSGNTSNLSYISTSYNFAYDKRDNISYPLGGFKIDVENSYIEQIKENAPSLFSSYFTGQYHTPIVNKLFYSTLLHTKISSLKNPPYVLLGGLGYGRFTVRGLELYVMEGQHYALSRNELKFQLFNKNINLGKLMPFPQFRKIPLALYPKVYLDGAYVYKDFTINGNGQLVNRPIWGTGFGLDIVSYYDFVMKLEYSLNNLGQSGFFLNLNSGF